MSGEIDSDVYISVTVQGRNGNLQESTGDIVFTYRNPSITSFEPTEGPEAGGTMVTIRGQYLDACRHISATIGSAECRISRSTDVINATTAKCRTTSAPVGISEQLNVFFDGAIRESGDLFTYRSNPIVTVVYPLKTIKSGGISLKVYGFGFDLAQEPRMILYTQAGPVQESCEVQNNGLMVCRTPDTHPSSADSIRSRRQAEPLEVARFGFIIADVTDMLNWSEDNNVTVAIFPDPSYFGFSKCEYYIIDIMGENLNVGSTQHDLTAYIGEVQASIVRLRDSTLSITIHDKIPGKKCVNGTITEHPCIYIFHGNLEFYIMYDDCHDYVDYNNDPGMLFRAVYFSIPVVVILFVAPIAFVMYLNRRLKRVKRECDALILERLMLLQQHADDLIQNLESNSKRAEQNKSILLPNNVAINPEDVKIRFNELTLGRALGHGAFGEVFLADLQEAGGSSIQVAVKSIQGKKDPSTIIKFLEEGLIMKDFDHPNVLGLIGLTFDPNGSPLVIIPLMENGDLKSFLKKTTMEISTEQRFTFAIDAAKGMAYLAGKKFVHRDLAARNCMVDGNLVVKIGDFGRSREMEDDYEYISQDKKAKLPVKWMAPESIGYRRYNEKTDVWSFGILMWEIFTNGAKPYGSIANRDIYNHISKGNRLECPEGCREDVYNIMLVCWNGNPKDRCTFQDLTRRLTTIIDSLATIAAAENQNNIALDGEMNRDSYLHPMEEKEMEGEDYVNDNRQLAIVDDDGYLDLEGQDNTAVHLEMTSLN